MDDRNETWPNPRSESGTLYGHSPRSWVVIFRITEPGMVRRAKDSCSKKRSGSSPGTVDWSSRVRDAGPQAFAQGEMRVGSMENELPSSDDRSLYQIALGERSIPSSKYKQIPALRS